MGCNAPPPTPYLSFYQTLSALARYSDHDKITNPNLKKISQSVRDLTALLSIDKGDVWLFSASSDPQITSADIRWG